MLADHICNQQLSKELQNSNITIINIFSTILLKKNSLILFYKFYVDV